MSDLQQRRVFHWICLLLILANSNALLAQEQFSAKVIDEHYASIAGAHIKNLRTNAYAVSDTSGVFHIRCKSSDTLLITAMGYDIKTIQVFEYNSPYVKMKAVYFELKQVNVYEFKTWAAFKNDFMKLEVPEQKVNVTGLPKNRKSKIPVNYRSDNFSQKPRIGNYIVSPFSTLSYYLNDEEIQKRKVWKMMQSEVRESAYWKIMQIDSLKEWTGIADSLLSDFVVYCNTEIEDKSKDNEYLYKEKIIGLYPDFLQNQNH